MSSVFNSKLNQTLFTLGLVGVVIALLSYSYVTVTQLDSTNVNIPMISVSGMGEISTKPDVAQFSFSVRADGADAATAQEKSGTAINSIMDYLTKESGIEAKDVKTENYNLNPKYRYEAKPCMAGSYCPPGNPVLDGFEVSQTITVKVRDIDKAGALLSGVGSKGATDISGLNFITDKPEEIKAQARDLAIADAKAKAQVLAKSLGVTLIKISSYSEDGQAGMPYAISSPMMDVRAESKGGFGGADIPTGENKIVSNVTITYEIK